MNVHTLTNPILTSRLFPVFRLESLKTQSGIQFSPQEFGYEIDEAELDIELAALSSKNNVHRLNQDVQTQDFEASYKWFLS